MKRNSMVPWKRKLTRWTQAWWQSMLQDRTDFLASNNFFTPFTAKNSVGTRRSRIETLEPRCLFNVDPVWIGGVYVEEDGGSDAHGDSFYITFRGGAPDTKLTRLVINTDQGTPGYSAGDNLFDTVDGGRGADHAFPFRVVSLDARDPNAKVTAQVEDGSMQLVLSFENFYAGDRLKFSIDVDEVQHLYSVQDLNRFNDGLDPIASGAEFEGSRLEAEFTSAYFEDARANGVFQNRYDFLVAPSALPLPADDLEGRRDRSAGTAASAIQIPKPISLAGTVFIDSNMNLVRDAQEVGIAGVRLDLYRRDGNNYVFTGRSTTTDTQGRYAFNLNLGLQPGVYQIRESQPNGFFSVGATPGQLDSKTPIGKVLANDPDTLTEIEILDGGTRGTELNFAEAQPAQIRGVVYRDNNNDGVQQSGETGIEGVELRIDSVQSNTGPAVSQTKRTARDGSYQFLGLPPGTYQITEVQPSGYFDGKDSVGRVGNQVRGLTTVNDVFSSIHLGSGDSGSEYNFGEIPPASVAGHVELGLPGFPCFTTDPNGKQPLSNVELTLVDANGNVIAKTRTLNDGSYRFENLPIGVYTILETQPADWIDGGSRAGTVQGQSNGKGVNGTRIEAISLSGADDGVGYDFCERMPSSLSGSVYADLDENGSRDATDPAIAGVVIELFNEQNQRIASTVTEASGNYRFVGLAPGVYSIRQSQPKGYFQGGQSVGSLGGDGSRTDELNRIRLSDGQTGVHYDFYEIPPASISGYVFQDGAPLVTENGQPPVNLVGIRDGWRTPDDKPISGVVLELRKSDGSVLTKNDLLEDVWIDQGLRVTTDALGRYEFRGLRPGIYHVIEKQPTGYFDGLDHAGSTGGVAIHRGTAVSAEDVALLDLLSNSLGNDVGIDAIVRVRARADSASVENNFSEIVVEKSPPPVVTPVPLPEATAATFRATSPYQGFVSTPSVGSVAISPMPESEGPQSIAGYPVDYTWHLSVINAGEPRGYQVRKTIDRAQIARSSLLLNFSQWTIDSIHRGRWYIVSNQRNKQDGVSREAFSLRGATPLAGDFNGDGRDELALFKDGEWLIDINGNGQWDRSDLWARLGASGDLPVVGDWDGDGKDDIGVWGLERAGDMAALEREPGLPDPENNAFTKPKNVPPTDAAEEMQTRWMQRSSAGEPRSDVIDHVFRFGGEGDQPVSGDFNGDGVSSLGIFRNGRWRLDVNGDGQFDSKHDTLAEFGRAGDIAIVGDFNGDGLDEIAVVRDNEVIVDSNGNGRMDATDRVFELQGEGDGVVVGDFDGDGIDEAAFFTTDRAESTEPIRQAKAG
ncbi:MAG: SdrD B-like domain-containing protein [Planctomycetota bacterium]